MNINLKIMYIFVISLFCTLLMTSLNVDCDGIKSKIYKPIQSNYFCFRKLNATNQMGCNSKEGGNVGVVYIIKNDSEIDYVVNSGPNYPYMAVIPLHYFKIDIMNRFKSVAHRISGVIVLDVKSRTDTIAYSPDNSCPNEELDLYANDSSYSHCKAQMWNTPDGVPTANAGLMHIDWPFPIYLIRNETSVQLIQNCFKQYTDWPLCAIQLVSPMNAAKDSVTCIRRTRLQSQFYFAFNPTLFCDPLRGNNIFNTLFETSTTAKISNNSVIVIASRMDSFSMFDQISPGADSAISSLVTLMSIAFTLNNNQIKKEIKDNLKKKDANVLYALFDGEAFDYIGSGRTVYDMKSGQFPTSNVNRSQVRSEHFSHFIELNQLGFHGLHNQTKQQIWIHKNLKSTKDLENLVQIIQSYINQTDDIELISIKNDAPLPPSSLQSFLKHNNRIVGIVVANHQKEYTNKLYNSLYDDINNLNKTDANISKRLSSIATVITKAIYELLTGKQRLDIEVNATLIDELLECYLISHKCDLFKKVMAPNFKFSTAHLSPYPTYVNSKATSRRHTYYTFKLFSHLTGDEVKHMSEDKCKDMGKEDELFAYDWTAFHSVNGSCFKSQAFITEALSPAFLSDQISHSDISSYSMWTQSQWRPISARIFIKPSSLQQWITLIIGIIILCLFFLIVYFINKNAPKLFDSNMESGQPSGQPSMAAY